MPEKHIHPETPSVSLEHLPGDTAIHPAPPLAVVGIGGSAGALDGYERFFLGLPPVTGLAFVVVPHLDPGHRGLMPDILRRCTSLPVLQIEDGMVLQGDQVYIIPPGFSLSILNGVLQLGDLADVKGSVIDTFFAALAADQREHTVGIVLSGMGTDGTRGIQAIKRWGGQVLVQDPSTAEYASMPSSAVATHLADAVLPPDDLAARLLSLTQQTLSLNAGALLNDSDPASAPLQTILRLVQQRTGHDFSRYKRPTLIRRIERRMLGWRIQDVSQYLKLLEEMPNETEALFQDFTINVTSFFRDTEAYAELKEHLRTYLQANKEPQGTLRVWVTACSTGEEAYSVAIVLHELTEEISEDQQIRVQIFATDIDRAAIDQARRGLYSREIAYVISPERLRRYFSVKGDQYQVRADIRESVVFATHNTFGDPPFTRLDLLCCRNMLIYIGPALQTQILALFRYALRPQGLLFLGTSESIGAQQDHFGTLSQHWKIYQRGEGKAALPPVSHTAVSTQLNQEGVGQAGQQSRQDRSHRPDTAQKAQKVLLAEYAPPAVVTDNQGEVHYVHGRTGRYLELSPGRGMNNVFEMAQGELRYELPAAVRQALTERRKVVRSQLHVEVEGFTQTLDLIVTPLTGPSSGLVMIVFQERLDTQGSVSQGASPSRPEKTDQVVALESELHHSRETLQATVEEMAVSLEEVRSTNEELQSTNEELQSGNEELMTSKEELQSLNEELTAINAEHQLVIRDLALANDDTKNLLEGAGTATVFLDNDLKIRRFTPFISAIIPLTLSDVGRPITDFHFNLRYDHLIRDVKRVLKTLEPFEMQVQTSGAARDGGGQTDGAGGADGGRWYLMRLSLYRTTDNYIGGVVVAFTNIDLIRFQGTTPDV
ncbi:chemotaxis protein [Deinococcus psychrotolerans]|uniref:protein-glutamate O-methyltransferase n=1 Tax=Deinococcus psychrotolerans TaxID=2489213 RepID=A0A3G8YFQ2_9DEIO|nr:CheR family methyltransferase [Deinococcus psychrotolerans]AZI44122.1 chemotaxis protein [Deinococcus psychrotolerans]